jgi:predicted nucleic acid-binding protein
MEQYVVDTHPLLWYLAADERIGNNAKKILERTEAGEVKVIVPAIVLIEAIEVINKKRVIYNVEELLAQISQRPNFIIKNLDLDIINLFKDYIPPTIPDIKKKPDSHDKIIIVTSQFFGNIPILTKDEFIQRVATTIW